MDFATVVRTHGEDAAQQALSRLVSRIRQIIQLRMDSAINGVLAISMEELREDARQVAAVLDEFPFTADEKCSVIERAWEIIGP